MTSVFDTAEFNGSLFFPRPDRTNAPDDASDLFFEADDATARLHVRLHGSATGRPVLLLFHGNGEVVSDYDRAAPKFAAAGVSLAVTDYRAYGESTGTPSFRTMIADAHAVLRGLRAAVQAPLFVMGRSLGGASAAELCKTAREGVVGYVFESSGSDLADLVRRRGLPVPTFSAEDLAAFDPLPKLAACRTPSLILHGRDDHIIHVREAEATHRVIPGSRLVTIEGHGHNDVSQSPKYWEALSSFVSECTRDYPG